MKRDIKVSASILCADFTKLGDEIKKCEDAGVDMIHIDVMDGHFVPNISIGQVIVEAVRSITKLPLDTHLMIEDPTKYVEEFIDAGADTVSIQVECYGERRAACRGYGQYPKEIDRLDAKKFLADVGRIHAKGKKAVAVINPGTPLCLDDVLGQIDGVLIMSVNPGFAKQKFKPEVLAKIKTLRDRGFEKDIAIDGGVNAETAPAAVQAGANILATASYFFGAKDPARAVRDMKALSA